MLHFLERRELCDILAEGASLGGYAVRPSTLHPLPSILHDDPKLDPRNLIPGIGYPESDTRNLIPQSAHQVPASRAEWRKQGVVLIQRNLLQQAAKCFQHSGDRSPPSPAPPTFG